MLIGQSKRYFEVAAHLRGLHESSIQPERDVELRGLPWV